MNEDVFSEAVQMMVAECEEHIVPGESRTGMSVGLITSILCEVLDEEGAESGMGFLLGLVVSARHPEWAMAQWLKVKLPSIEAGAEAIVQVCLVEGALR